MASRSANQLGLLGPSLQLFAAAVSRTNVRDPVGGGSQIGVPNYTLIMSIGERNLRVISDYRSDHGASCQSWFMDVHHH